MNKFKQVLTKDWEILCLKGQQMDKARGNKREISRSLMARKQSFASAYLKGDSHLRGYCTWLLPKHPGMPCWQKKKDKKGTNNHEDRCLTSDASVWCLPAEGLSWACYHETCPFLLDLLCCCTCFCLKPATLLLLSPCTFALDHLNSVQQDTAGSWWWLSLLYIILASFLSFLSPAFPSPSP